jgi:hypothetical protein
VGSASAQESPSAFYYALPLFDVGINISRYLGVTIAAAPGWRSVQGSASTRAVVLNFDPDSLLPWLDQAGAVLRLLAPVELEDGIQWIRPLHSLQHNGSIQLGRSREHGVLGKSHWLVIGDSLRSWRIELTAEEADSAYRLLAVAAGQSGVADEPNPPATPATVGTPVAVLEQPAPEASKVYGHVVLQYVVDANGKVEPASVRVVLATDERLANEARKVILAGSYRPATIGGKPVRERVQQSVTWKPPGA